MQEPADTYLSRGDFRLGSIRKWLPAYLWYSGILFQCFAFFLGFEAVVRFAWDRPTEKLDKAIHEKLADSGFCSAIFAGQEFSWLNPKPFTVEVYSRGAEVEQLSYRSSGSVGRNEHGHHLYRIWFETAIRDMRAQAAIKFPPRSEMLFEVDARNFIVRCTPDEMTRSPASDLQEVSVKPCESPGWSRRLLCDRGTERCYPLNQCEKAGGS